jgi:hypothetical protein
MSVFDEEPDAPLHGECAAEISRLTAERDAARHGWNECEKLGNYQFDQSRKQIVSLRAQVAAADAIAKAINDSDSCEGFITDEIYEALEAYDALKTSTT